VAFAPPHATTPNSATIKQLFFIESPCQNRASEKVITSFP
jgi:hypothetical protein